MKLVTFVINSLLLALFLHIVMGGFAIQALIIIGVFIVLEVLAVLVTPLKVVVPFIMIGAFVWLAVTSILAIGWESFGDAYALSASLLVGIEMFVTEVML
jgi:hypothetical protein